MKTLLVFLAGLGIGAFGLYYYHLQSETTARKLAASETRLGETARSAARTAATKAQEVAADMSGAVSGRIEAWHLSPDDIKADLAKTGQVVRANATRAGEKIADARIVAVIKAKFVLDRSLSAHAIEIECQDGNVTLTGSVATADLVAKAVTHALDTEGVHRVTAKLAIRPTAG